MMIVRPIKNEDFEGVYHCALTAGLGMTNLPKNPELLKKRIRKSIDSFNKEVSTPDDEEYLFVLYDTDANQIAGTCGIFSKIGTSVPFFTYAISQFPEKKSITPSPTDRRILSLKSYSNGPSEICALYILPEYRHGGFGKLLSLSRFLFIASFQNRFENEIIANMRGLMTEGTCDFWDGLGRKFFNVSYDEVMAVRAEDESIISDILPAESIFALLLPSETANAIGQTHPHTKPALEMLKDQNFHFCNEIDPLDGGPILKADKTEIKTVKNCIASTVGAVSTELIDDKSCLIAKDDLSFRVCYGAVQKNKKDQITISKKVANALKIEEGSRIRYFYL